MDINKLANGFVAFLLVAALVGGLWQTFDTEWAVMDTILASGLTIVGAVAVAMAAFFVAERKR